MGDSPPSEPEAPAETGPEISEATERPQLLRKVAQLTKVVMHLTAKNTQSEEQYEEMEKELEEEVTAVVEKALGCVQDATLKFEVLAEKTRLPENAERLEQLFGQQRRDLAIELQQLKEDALAQKAVVVEKADVDLTVTIQKVQDVSQKMRESLENYRQTLKCRAQEMEQRNEELRQDRQVELQAVAGDFDRRLEELRGSLRREAEHARQSTENAMLHMRRMHEAETSSQQMAALQRRHERMQNLEHSFAEERRMREQQASSAEMELMQQRKDLLDFKTSFTLVDQQVDVMRGTLEEMRLRTERAVLDAEHARAEAALAEGEVAALAKEIALLEVRQRSAGMAPGTVAVPPKPPRHAAAVAATAGSGGSALTEELREVITNTKQVEHELAAAEARLGDLEDELAERDKTVEILEVETEEERLRTHRLQTRIVQLSGAT